MSDSTAGPPSAAATSQRRILSNGGQLLAALRRVVGRVRWVPSSAPARRLLVRVGWVLLLLASFCVAYALLVIGGR